MKASIVILAGGGPAPGINTVIGTIAKTFLAKGYRVIGLHEGYKGLFSENPSHIDIDFFLADNIYNRGGSYLMMSRFKPTDDDLEHHFNLKFFTDNNIKLLVTIGGDDTASTANRLTKYLLSHDIHIQNIHVPKTIDNLGIASSCHYPMLVIPEMFNKTNATIDKIVRLAVSAIIKRKIMGITYGGVIVSEGIFYELSSEDLKATGVTFSYDEHGHPELGKVSKAQIFCTVLEKKLGELGLKAKIRPIEIGYDVRCNNPVSYDITYCSQMAYGVWKLFESGETGCMVYVDRAGDITPLYLKDLQDPTTGKIPPRCVDISREQVQNIVKYMLHYIGPEDYEAARKYVANPEEYDFYRILNWERPEK